MKKIFTGIGGFVGGSIFWWAAEDYGMMTAFMVSMIGTGLGIYAGIKMAERFDF